jgi:Zn-dependent protease
MWLLSGRVFIFRFWRVDVYVHASLLVLSVLVLLFGTPFGNTPLDRFIFVIILFGIILLHEFGHIFGARVSGGEASHVELTPLGGLAFTAPAKGPRPTLITVICGPLVNVLICLVCGALLWVLTGYAEIGPFSIGGWESRPSWFTPAWLNVAFYLFYIYSISYFLLLFNMLPIFPLDGGRTLQALLWFKLSYYKSMLFTAAFGMVGAVLLFMWGIVVTSLLMALIAVMCFMACLQIHRLLKAEGPWAFADQDEPDWSRSMRIEPEKEGFFARRRRVRQERREAAEAERAADMEREVDGILAKISREGRDSLSAHEKRVLERATAAKQQYPRLSRDR